MSSCCKLDTVACGAEADKAGDGTVAAPGVLDAAAVLAPLVATSLDALGADWIAPVHAC